MCFCFFVCCVLSSLKQFVVITTYPTTFGTANAMQHSSCFNVLPLFGREPATFVKELIYRSLERQNLDKVYRQIQELRKRLRTREQKAVSAIYSFTIINSSISNPPHTAY